MPTSDAREPSGLADGSSQDKLPARRPCVGDERDFVRVRTNIRKDEDAYLFRLSTSPEKARERFMEYVKMSAT